jgi:ABC-type multidrug transport system fused ATPase/permease subunit
MLRGHRSRVVLAALLSVGAVVGHVLIPLLAGDAVNQIDDGDRGELVLSGLGLVGAALLAAVSQGRQRVDGAVSVDVEYEQGNRYFSHLQYVDLRFLQSEPVDQLLSRGTVDLTQIRNFLGSGVSSLAQDFGTILLAAVVMFALDADAHLLETVRDADRIVILGAGRVVGSGTDEELLKAGGAIPGLYREWQDA